MAGKIEPLKKLASSTTQMTPYNIFTMYFNANGYEKDGFTLRPIYQRNVVWGKKQYLKFIESVFYGIVPSPIVFALETKTNGKTCVDGKQRLTSLVKFFTNEIPYHEAKTNKIILYWYSEIKDDTDIKSILESIYQIKNFENKLITPEMKCWMESGFQLTLVQYIDIDYEQQIDIFNRIQYGMTISRGSYLKSFISDAKLCELIVKRANEYSEYFGNYVKNVNNEDHIKLMVEYFLMLENNIVTIKSDTVDYELKKMTLKSFEKMDKKYENLIKTMFSKELFGANEFKQKKVIIKCLLYAKEKMDSNTFDKNKMKYVLEQIWEEINEEKNQFKSKELEEFIDKQWNSKSNTGKKTYRTKSSNSKVQVESSDSESTNSNDSNDSELEC